MARCGAEMCAYWTGDGCACDVLGLDEHPDEWADAVEFDAAIRAGSARATAQGKNLLGQAFLHRSRLPLADAPIDRVTYHEWSQRQGDIFDAIAEQAIEDGPEDGCSPFACRSDGAA